MKGVKFRVRGIIGVKFRVRGSVGNIFRVGVSIRNRFREKCYPFLTTSSQLSTSHCSGRSQPLLTPADNFGYDETRIPPFPPNPLEIQEDGDPKETEKPSLRVLGESRWYGLQMRGTGNPLQMRPQVH